MKSFRIIKKFKQLTPGEERGYAKTLNDSANAVAIVKKYLEQRVIKADTKLGNTQSLYSGSGDCALKVACLLAEREAHLNLLNLLTETFDLLDVDHTGD